MKSMVKIAEQSRIEKQAELKKIIDDNKKLDKFIDLFLNNDS